MKTLIDEVKLLKSYSQLKKSIKSSGAIVTFLAYNFKCGESEVRHTLEKAGILSPRPVTRQKSKSRLLTSKPEEKTAKGPIPTEYRPIVNYIWEKYDELKEEHAHSDVFNLISIKHYPFEKREGEEYRLWTLAIEQCRKLNRIRNNKSLTAYPTYKVRELEV